MIKIDYFHEKIKTTLTLVKTMLCDSLNFFKELMVSIFNLFKNQRTIDSNSLKKKNPNQRGIISKTLKN